MCSLFGLHDYFYFSDTDIQTRESTHDVLAFSSHNQEAGSQYRLWFSSNTLTYLLIVSHNWQQFLGRLTPYRIVVVHTPIQSSQSEIQNQHQPELAMSQDQCFITTVVLRRAQLVLGWVTIFRQVIPLRYLDKPIRSTQHCIFQVSLNCVPPCIHSWG